MLGQPSFDVNPETLFDEPVWTPEAVTKSNWSFESSASILSQNAKQQKKLAKHLLTDQQVLGRVLLLNYFA